MKKIELTKKSKLWLIAALSAIMIFTLAACGGSGASAPASSAAVKDGEMTIHVTLASTHIVNLYPGTAAEAKKQDKDDLLQPTTEKVKYDDGTTEEAYAFDVPVPEIDKEFDCALIGTKGKWYDHKVKVTNPVKEDK